MIEIKSTSKESHSMGDIYTVDLKSNGLETYRMRLATLLLGESIIIDGVLKKVKALEYYGKATEHTLVGILTYKD